MTIDEKQNLREVNDLVRLSSFTSQLANSAVSFLCFSLSLLDLMTLLGSFP